MGDSVADRFEEHSFFDGAIIRHGFVDYMRDYRILVAGLRPPYTDWHQYDFVGCVEADLTTRLPAEVFVRSLPDDFVYSGPDYPEKDDPSGFIWGVRFSVAYPGLEYVEGGPRAREWSDRLGIPMHEVRIETNAFVLTLVFVDFRYREMGDEGEIVVAPKDYPIPVGAE